MAAFFRLRGVFFVYKCSASCIGIRYNIALLNLVYPKAVITRECKHRITFK